MAFVVNLESYQGPFDVLLELLSKKKLDITEVSLSSITADYLGYIENTSMSLEELNWFLYVAAKLALEKSTILLMNEQDEADLESSLLRYQAIKKLSSRMAMLMKTPFLSSAKKRQADILVSDIPKGLLFETYQELIEGYEARPKSKLITTQKNKLDNIRLEFIARLKKLGSGKATEILASSKDRTEAIVGLMTLLEMLKNGRVGMAGQSYVLMGEVS
jgi:segregation and condensation protein A